MYIARHRGFQTTIIRNSDITPPTCSITSSQATIVSSSFTVTFTLSEPSSDFSVSAVSVNNGVLGGFSGSGLAYTAVITPTNIGNVTISVASNSFHDNSNNLNTTSSQFTIFYTTKASPTITPTFGAEDVTNGTMESGNPPTSWNTSNGGSLSSVADERTGGSGSSALSVINTTVGYGGASQLLQTTANTYVKFSVWGKNVTGNGTALIFKSTANYDYFAQLQFSSTSWVNKYVVFRLPSASFIGISNSSTVGKETHWDDLSVLPIDFASMRSYMGSNSSKNGIYQCRPTMTTSISSPVGILIEYLDDNNFVQLVIDSGSVSLISRIAGVYTTARTGSVTYGANNLLKCVVNGTTHQLFYNNVQIGADVTIDNSSLGTDVYAFNGLAGNSVGIVSVFPDGVDATQQTELYVATSGLSTNDGSYDYPIDLQTALNNNYGYSTIMLRGGTYTANDFTCNISGTQSSPISIKPYPTERPIIDTGFDLKGSWVHIYDLEFKYSGWTTRDEADVSSQTNLNRLILTGSNNKLIHCLVHDMPVGPYSGRSTVQTETYGCLLYYNGYMGSTRGHGHNTYQMNPSGQGTKKISKNILFDSYSYGIHCYDESANNLSNLELTSNISYGAGELASPTFTRRSNILLGGYNVVASNPVISGNYTYHRGSAYNNNLGYSGGADTVTLTNNYMPDGLTQVNVTNLTASGNTFDVVGNQAFLTTVSEYEVGRANLAIYNEALSDTVTVDVSSLYSNGTILQVHNSQDYYGDIQSLTVTGGNIDVDMRAISHSVVAPEQHSAPDTTFPQFGAFIIKQIS